LGASRCGGSERRETRPPGRSDVGLFGTSVLGPRAFGLSAPRRLPGTLAGGATSSGDPSAGQPLSGLRCQGEGPMAGKECGATQRSCPLRGYATSFESLPAPVPYLSRCCRELVGVHGPPDSAAFRAPPHRRDFTAGRFWFGSADVVAHRNRMVPGRTCFEDSPNPRTEERRVRGRRVTCRLPPPSRAAQEASSALRPLWSRPSRLSLAPGPTELRRTERETPGCLKGPPLSSAGVRSCGD
jgi:hypothetical protein